jgi:hypothetical protein
MTLARDPNQMMTNILNREATPYGSPRIPFWFGSYKSTGIDIRQAIQGDVFSFGGLQVENGRIATAPVVEFWKFLRLGVNPSGIVLTPFIRISEARTAAGRVYYNWVNETGSAIEAYELQLSGMTGNLLPGNPDERRKLYSWMKLRELTLEERETVDIANPTLKKINEQFILVRTIGIPTTTLFIGFYKVPITFSEKAESQYNHDWSCTFVVTDMYPRYEKMSASVVFSVFPELFQSGGQ